MKRKLIRDIYASPETGTEVHIKGWVRTRRSIKNVQFIAVNDGSTIHSMQCVVDLTTFSEEYLKQVTTGSAIGVTGLLIPSPGQQQPVEIQVRQLEIYGASDPEKYPLQKKGHSLEFLREIAHLRLRTNTFGAVFRIRHALAFAIHKFFHDRHFYYLHTPIITATDAEGAGEMFCVTSFDLNNIPRTDDGQTDFKKDFFGRQTHLTVSGQLEAELGALALGQVYTFGPTFRAENSNTPRHLAEFWMIEPEMAFYDIHDNMDLAEEMLKYLIRFALDNSRDDLQFLSKMYDRELITRLESVISIPFKRISYTEAIDLLKNASRQFEFPVKWGNDLQKEHEHWLVNHFNAPVIITDYPREIKAFYMKQNDDGKTVRAMDILFPWIGEIIGGSQREDDYQKLLNRIRELGMSEESLWWYLDTRRFGTVPHSGFGLGFERLLLFVTGMNNIRDVIPFPRTPGNAEF
jgi:asparaginyl-tRNA synthetase